MVRWCERSGAKIVSSWIVGFTYLIMYHVHISESSERHDPFPKESLLNRPELQRIVSGNKYLLQRGEFTFRMKLAYYFFTSFHLFLTFYSRFSWAMSPAASTIGKLVPQRTAFLLCDIQEKFRPLIYNMETVICTTRYLTSVAQELNIPIICTQQYTKVFGPTISDCFADAEFQRLHVPVFDKKKFSMLTDEVINYISTEPKMNGRTSFVLFGIEAHVCVQQTCLDLLEMGKDVHIIADALSSQQKYDREIAVQRMINSGAFLTTAQSATFMLMQGADHPQFKPVSKLTTEHMKTLNEFNSK